MATSPALAHPRNLSYDTDRPQVNTKGNAMTITHEHPAENTADAPLTALWAEITGKCQLSCIHCYAGSGPDGTHGTMTAGDWERVLTEAAALGTRAVCFIGGEPTAHPALPSLVHRALNLGMKAEIYSNLVHVTPALWELIGTPGVQLATSYYTDNRDQHKAITGRDTLRQTRASIAEAVRRGIPLRVGMVDGIIPGQRTAEGERELRALGAANVGTDRVREFGRGTNPDPSQACGNCGQGRAAVLPDGSVTPCPLTRWMRAGNVHAAALGDTLATVTDLASTLPARGPKCYPDECFPDWKPCRPGYSSTAGTAPPDRNPPCNPDDCRPDVFCPPLCSPHPCSPAY